MAFASVQLSPRSSLSYQTRVIRIARKERITKCKAAFHESQSHYRWAYLCCGTYADRSIPEHSWWFYGCPKGVVAQIPGDVPGPGTPGWTQYQSCLQQNLTVSPQQSAQMAPILANEGRKVMAPFGHSVEATQLSFVANSFDIGSTPECP